MMIILVFCLLIALSGCAGIFFLARGLRKKLNARRYTLQDARAQGTMFFHPPYQDPETLPPVASSTASQNKNDALRVRQMGARYRRFQVELRRQARFEAQDTIELPAVPPPAAGARETEPIRKYPLVRETERVRSVWPHQSKPEKKR